MKGAKPAVPTSLVKIGPELEHLKIGAKTWQLVYDQEATLYWPTEHVAVANHAEAMKVGIKIHGMTFGPPTRKQMFSLVDDTRYAPAFDRRFFPNCPSSGIFWTKTPFAPIGGSFWYVDAYLGYAYGYRPGGGGFVRAVSPGQ